MLPKNAIRTLAALFCALPLALGACAPGDKPAPVDTAGSSDVTDTAPQEYAGPYLTLAENGTTEYTILFPDGSPQTLIDACQSLRAAFREKTSARISCENDELPSWATLPEDAPEILVGLTNRDASARAYETLVDAGDYVIAADGSRIVIIGGSDAATVTALEYFAGNCLGADGDGALLLRADFRYAVGTQRYAADAALTADQKYCNFTVSTSRGAAVDCRLSFTGNSAWRLQTKDGDAFDNSGAGQMLASFLGEEPYKTAETLTLTETDAAYTLTESGGSSVVVTKNPFRIECRAASGTVTQVITSLSESGNDAVLRGSLSDSEAIFGTGERFNSVNQRGKRIELSAIDIWCGIEGNSYTPIPLLISSRGSGMFMNRYEKMTLDIGAAVKNRWEITLSDAPVDLYLYATENPRDVLYGYSVLTGFAPEPASWMYGTAVCRYAPDFSTAAGVYAMADAMEKNDFPWDSVILEGWSAYDQTRWSELKEMVDTLHGMGKKVLVYSTTGRATGTSLPQAFHVMREDTLSIQLPDTNSYNPVDNPNSSTSRYVDITSESAWSWWVNSLWGRLIREVGIDGSKIDFCEQFPEHVELIFENGETSGAHHWYPTFYNTLMYNLFSEKEDGGMVLARGGGIGAQRYPFIWAGDQRREYQYLAAQLKACLSAGLSGIPFMSYDMAGYRPAQNSDPEARVFVRGIEFTAFSPNIQTHGTVSRPYDFADDVKDIYRTYAYVHEALRPYIEEQGRIACETAVPLMRHLALDYFADENVWNIDDEYMFGEGLLVAPVLDGGEKRDIYLPAGEWTSLTTGEVYVGGQTLKDVSVPLDEIPAFVKSGHASQKLEECLDAVRALLAGET